MRSFAVYHLFPFILAATCCTGVILLTPFREILFSSPAPLSQDHSSYYANWQNPHARKDMQQSLADGTTLVIFGSSELTHGEDPAVPYRFLNANGIKTIACGEAGNQCLNILAQLATLRNSNDYGKIVIYLSPGWFEEYAAGTDISVFLEYMDEKSLYEIAFQPGLDEDTRVYIGDYLFRHLGEVESPSSVMRYLAYHGAASTRTAGFMYKPFAAMHRAYCREKTILTNYLFTQHQYPFRLVEKTWSGIPSRAIPEAPEIRWTYLFDSCARAFDAISNNNTWGVENTYYNDWVHGRRKKIRPVPEKHNREWKDYCALLEFLKKTNYDVQFILLPLNPLAHEDLHVLKPLLDKVKTRAIENHFAFYDMMEYEPARYRKGTLHDIMHFGSLGWYKTDSAIIHHFCKP